MDQKGVLIITLFCIVSAGCQPKTDIQDIDRQALLEAHRRNLASQLEGVKERQQLKRKEDLVEYTSFRDNSEKFGWEPFDLNPFDSDVIACLPDLKAKFERSNTNIRFNTELIRTARIQNDQKFGLITTDVLSSYGFETKMHTILDLSTCKSVRSASETESVHIAPKSGEIAHSPISPDEGDNRLLFLRDRGEKPFETFVNVQKNGIATLAKPDFGNAVFAESIEDSGCLFSVLNEGEAAANNLLLSNLCPSSTKLLQPMSVTYQLHYLWFGDAEIIAHIARPRNEEKGIEILVPMTAKDLASTDYLFQLRHGVVETPQSVEIDLSTTGYVWSPYAWHSKAWEKPAENDTSELPN